MVLLRAVLALALAVGILASPYWDFLQVDGTTREAAARAAALYFFAR